MVFDSSKFRYTRSEPEAIGPYADWSDEELTDIFEERAAIVEYDGGTSRPAAEKMALDWMKSEIVESRFKVWGGKPNNVTIQKMAADRCRIYDQANH